MATIISLRIFLLCNSILLYFVPKKLISLLSSSSWFSTLPDTKTAPQPSPAPPSAAQTSTELKRVFEMFDRNGDGRISQKELSESLGNLGMSIPEEELSVMIQKIDANKDGCVDLSEFEDLYGSIMGEDLYGSIMGERDEDNDMKEVFRVFDQNGDGYITSNELNSVLESLKQGKTIEDCKVMIRKVDVDGDGRIDYKEFTHMMKGGGFIATSG